ncbi:MAG: SMR family transporter [Chloroflexota bacterium]
MGILFLLAAIIIATLGTLAIYNSSNPNAPWWMSWVSWFVFTPTFICLFYAFEDFGVASTFALWGAGTGLLVTIQGVRWGDRLSNHQMISISLVLGGLLLFGLGG